MSDSLTPTRITLTRPDDWHLHLRDGAVLKDVLPHTAKQFARAIVMPNLKPPVTTVALAKSYHERIMAITQWFNVQSTNDAVFNRQYFAR